MNFKVLCKINHYSLIIEKCFYKINLYIPGRIVGFFTQKRTLPFLEKNGIELLTKNYDFNNLCIAQNPPIFIMWYQGFDQLPVIIEKCIESIKKNIKNREIIYISRQNITQYADIPEYILNLVDNNVISKTMFSDICRAALLYKNGGTWIDAAVFLSKEIDNEYFNAEFYSPCGIYSELRKDFRYLFRKTNGWNISFQGSKYINFPLYDFLYNFYLVYFKKYQQNVYYFMTDFCISLFLKHNKNFKEIIQKQKVNNQYEFQLALLMNRKINNRTLRKLEEIDSTYIHKLTYKKKWVRTKNGKKTVYDYILFKKN